MSRSAKFNLTVLLGFGLTFALLSIAHAAGFDPLPTLPNVTNDPLGAASGVWSFLEHYGPLWGGVTALYLLTGPLLAKAEADHWQWLATGRRNAIAHAVVNVLGAAMIAHFTDHNWPAVVASAAMSLWLVLHPAPADKPAAAPAAKAEGGFVNRDMLPILGAISLAFVLLVGALGGCGATTKQIGHDVYACAKQTGDAALDAVKGQVIQDALDPTTLSQKLDKLVADLESDGLTDALSFVKCAATAVANDLAAKLHATAGTPLGEATADAKSLDALNGWLLAHGDK